MIKRQSSQLSLSNNKQAYQNTKTSKEQLQSFTTNSSDESLSIENELSHKYDSIILKQDTSFQSGSTVKNREEVLSSSLICTLKDDQSADIIGDDTQDTINSVKSFKIKVFSPFHQKSDNHVQQQQISQQTVYSQDDEKQQLQFNYDSDQGIQTNTPISLKSETNSSKQYSNKKVTFSDIIKDEKIRIKINNDHQQISSISYFLQQSQSETPKDQKNQDCEERSRAASKSILKRPQPYKQKPCKNYQLISNNLRILLKKEFQNEPQRHQFNMEFTSLNRECLFENNNYDTNQDGEYFFSEEVIKISNCGDQKKRMIIVTQNLFYVFQDLQSNQHIQRFELSEISKIIVSSRLKNVCSIIVRNTYQLNLQINHFCEFIQFIQTIFQRSFKTLFPIIFNKNKERSDQSKVKQTNNTETKMEQNSQKKGFSVSIQYIINDIEDENSQKKGLIYFFSNKIWLTGLNKKELIQINLTHKNLQNKSFLFELQKSPQVKFQIKLNEDFDFPLFLNKLNNFYDHLIKNNQSDLLK